jgi:hypothetical protein
MLPVSVDPPARQPPRDCDEGADDEEVGNSHVHGDTYTDRSGTVGANVAAVLAGFALRFVAEVLRKIIGEGREEGGPDAPSDASKLYSSARRGKGA